MKRILGRALSPSLAISALALSLALGGGSALAVAGLIGTGQIKNGAVTTPKLANGAVTAPKLANGAVTPAKVAGMVCRNVTVFTNGWKNIARGDGFHAARICIDSLRVVHLEGVLTGGTAFTGAFTLPRALRPAFNHAFAVAAGVSGPTLENVDVFTDGVVLLNGAATDAVSLDGVSFPLR
jgi:hypothetical protein